MPFSICQPLMARARDVTTITTGELLSVITQAIEDVILQGVPEVDLAIGVMRFSAVLPELPRYQALAGACRHLWLCGVPDVVLPPLAGISVVPLGAEWPLAAEQFIAASAPTFTTALVAEELIHSLSGYARRFAAVFTSEPQLVDTIYTTLAPLLGQSWSPPTRDETAQERHLAALSQRLIYHQSRRLTWPTTPAGTPGALPGQARGVGERLIAHVH